MTSSSSDGALPTIPNVYKPPYSNYQCYFLKVRLLTFLLYGIKDREQRRGVKLARITGFLRLYGYQTQWIYRSVEELVRDRLLESLEAPLESDYTKNYELRQQHSFRISPLSVTLFEQVLDKPIYLALVGYDIPFFNYDLFKLYQKEFESIASILDERQIEEAAIDLLIETNLANLVAAYLYEMLKIEQISNKTLLTSPEVESVERKLTVLANSFKSYKVPEELALERQKELLSVKENDSRRKEIQKSLFDGNNGAQKDEISENDKQGKREEYLVPREAVAKINIPKNILSMDISRSQQAPLIFWSLVALRASGYQYNSGVEITKVINTYLVGDHQKKFPNNISRALRQPALVSQPWLDIAHKYQGNRNFFGLTDNWPIYWREYFQEDAPKI